MGRSTSSPYPAFSRFIVGAWLGYSPRTMLKLALHEVLDENYRWWQQEMTDRYRRGEPNVGLSRETTQAIQWMAGTPMFTSTGLQIVPMTDEQLADLERFLATERRLWTLVHGFILPMLVAAIVLLFPVNAHARPSHHRVTVRYAWKFDEEAGILDRARSKHGDELHYMDTQNALRHAQDDLEGWIEGDATITEERLRNDLLEVHMDNAEYKAEQQYDAYFQHPGGYPW